MQDRRNGKSYFKWLCSLVQDNPTMRCYSRLLMILHERTFRYFIPNDDNRAFEGKNLRELFIEKTKVPRHMWNEIQGFDCTMLELFISLAMRCENLTDNNMKLSEWFWILICNAELDNCDDIAYDTPMTVNGKSLWSNNEVNHKLDRIIDRTYRRNGCGGLFPLKHSRKDQRKVELWYQMCEYLGENYT
jgi:hypothetical protein